MGNVNEVLKARPDLKLKEFSKQYFAKFPVVSCPPDGMNQTCLTNPPGSSNAFIVKPANIGKFAAQAFAQHSPEIDAALQAAIAEKIVKLEKADEQLAKRQRTGTQ